MLPIYMKVCVLFLLGIPFYRSYPILSIIYSGFVLGYFAYEARKVGISGAPQVGNMRFHLEVVPEDELRR
jgi:hypothetical protein